MCSYGGKTAEEMPLSSREYSALLSIFAAESHYAELFPLLKRRAELIPGLWDKMQELSVKSEELLAEVCRTIPLKKRQQIKMELAHVQLYVRIEPPGCVQTIDTAGYSYLPTRTVNEMLAYLCENECMLCEKTATEARKCKVRHMIEEAIPHRVGTKDSANCKYADFVLGLEEPE